MASRPTRLSIVCPAFEEEDCLPLFHRELCRVLAELGPAYVVEIIYVDDGSRDDTLDVAKRLAAEDGRVRYLSLSRNFGHQAALTAGLEHAGGDVVVTMDADLQHPPAILPRLLARWREGFDVVLTIRAEDRRLSLGKRMTSRLFYRVMDWLSDTDIRPAGSDFRLMSRKAVAALLQLRERHRFLRGMVQWLGFRTAEVHFHPDERKAGQSKYTLRRMLKLAGDGLFSFSRAPLRVSFYLGLFAFAACFMLALWGVGHAWFGASASSPDFLLLSSLYFLGGSILWAVGILGEYVGRIYEQVKERPVYLLKDSSPEFAQGKPSDATPPPREAA
jgi:polyisoprenyl-phosphate glycosyltransferase